MQKVFFETGKGGIGYVSANGFGAVMVSDQVIDSISMVLLIAFVWENVSRQIICQFDRGSAVTGVRVK